MPERSRDADTIVAVATPLMRSAIAVIRVSGPETQALVGQMVASIPAPRQAAVRTIRADQQAIDDALVLFFQAPASFTGEDVVELHLHGNPKIALAVVQQLQMLGARAADPGEFTRRAVINGRMSVEQAEATGALIDAASLASASDALRSLQNGQLGYMVAIEDDLIATVAQLEALTDFADEDIEPENLRQIVDRFERIVARLQAETDGYRSARGYREGVQIVIAGPPNAGKSSLLNIMSGQNRALVSEIAGTTRDYVDVSTQWNGLPVQLVDTAGIRSSSDDVIENAGIERSQNLLHEADVVIWLVDPSGDDPVTAEALRTANSISDEVPIFVCKSFGDSIQGDEYRRLSHTGLGVEELQHEIVDHFRENLRPTTLISDRQMVALEQAMADLGRAQAYVVAEQGELAAESVYEARNALSCVLGEYDRDRTLDAIFSQFCVGK